MQTDVDALAGRYAERPTGELRERIVAACLDDLRGLAIVLQRRRDWPVPLEDLVQDGALGVMDALERFDPGRRVRFWTFAARRARGAMIDAARRRDPAGRISRARAARLDQAAETLRQEMGREPGDDETALAAGMGAQMARQARRRTRAASPGSLDAVAYEGDGGQPVAYRDLVRDAKAEEPERRAQAGTVRELVMLGCSRQERVLLAMYHWEGYTMREIGAVLDLSESRVSQMHTDLMHRLRLRLAGRQEELVA